MQSPLPFIRRRGWAFHRERLAEALFVRTIEPGGKSTTTRGPGCTDGGARRVTAEAAVVFNAELGARFMDGVEVRTVPGLMPVTRNPWGVEGAKPTVAPGWVNVPAGWLNVPTGRLNVPAGRLNVPSGRLNVLPMKGESPLAAGGCRASIGPFRSGAGVAGATSRSLRGALSGGGFVSWAASGRTNQKREK